MSVIDRVMAVYPYVFHPAIVLGGGMLIAIYWEWDRQRADRETLGRRVAAFLGAGICSLVPTAAYMLATGAGPMETMQGNAWRVDALVASGIFIAAGVTYLLWTRGDWGGVVPGMAVTMMAVAVPYVALSPLWNISGHVILSVTPALYLTLVDRSFWPLMVVPVVMVPNRIAVNAHTWPQAIAGFVVGSAVVLGVYWLRHDGSLAEPTASAPS